MSCFCGKFKEYPSISVDCFTKENLESKAFFLSHCHKDHMDGLDSVAFANLVKFSIFISTSSNLFIYCSDTTRNLLLCNQSYVHLKDYLVGIPIEQPYLVTLLDEETNKKEVISVTLLSAGHCVGSVMFLFEGINGNVLYTGDFRLAKGDVQRIKLLHTSSGIKDIKSVYIDTTFCLPQMMSIPSRKETRDAVIQIIDRWISRGSTNMVSLQCKGMYGYEYLLKEIAQHYKTKIHISKERLALYQYLTDMTPYFTTDAKATRIHSCKWDKTCTDVRSSLPCGFTLPNGVIPKVIKIKPSTMWFARRSDPLPEDNSIYCKEKNMWRVVHSMHASMEEIIDLVAYLKPYHVYPNVEPGGLHTVDDAWQWLKEYTRIDECDSCSHDNSGHRDFKAMAAEFKISPHEQVQRKARKSPADLSTSHKVSASYKELGLEEDTSLNPLPAKRKRRVGFSCNKESTATIRNSEDKPDPLELERDNSDVVRNQENLPTGIRTMGSLSDARNAGSPSVSRSTGSPSPICKAISPPSSCLTGSALSNTCNASSPPVACVAQSPPTACTVGSPPSACNAGSPLSACTAGSLPSACNAGSPLSACTAGSLPSVCTAGSPPSAYTADSPRSVCTAGSPSSAYTAGSPPNVCHLSSAISCKANTCSPPNTCAGCLSSDAISSLCEVDNCSGRPYDVFDIPASPGIQAPSNELLANFFTQLENDDLKL